MEYAVIGVTGRTDSEKTTFTNIMKEKFGGLRRLLSGKLLPVK